MGRQLLSLLLLLLLLLLCPVQPTSAANVRHKVVHHGGAPPCCRGGPRVEDAWVQTHHLPRTCTGAAANRGQHAAAGEGDAKQHGQHSSLPSHYPQHNPANGYVLRCLTRHAPDGCRIPCMLVPLQHPMGQTPGLACTLGSLNLRIATYC